MKKIFFGLLMLFAVASCKSTMPTVTSEQTSTKTITETVHDTIFKIEKDSSAIQALLECQNGKIFVKEVTHTQPGRNLKSPKVVVANNQLTVDCQLDEQALYAKWTEQNTTEVKTVTNTKIIEVNKLTFWQELQLNCLWAIVASAALTIGYIRIKNYLKTV